MFVIIIIICIFVLRYLKQNIMKKRITREDHLSLQHIIKTYGYWSENYSDFLELFCHTIRHRVHELARYYEKY